MKIKSLTLLTLLVFTTSVLFGAQRYNYWTTYDGDGRPTGTNFIAGSDVGNCPGLLLNYYNDFFKSKVYKHSFEYRKAP